MDYTQLCMSQLSHREEWLRRSVGSQYFNLVHSFWFYITEEPMLRASLDDLVMRYPQDKEDLEAMLEGKRGFVGKTLEEQAAIAFNVFQIAINRALTKLDERSKIDREARVSPRDDLEEAASYFVARSPEYDRSPEKRDASLSQAFHSCYVVPIVQYLQDVLASHATGTYLLRRYKARVEWFHRERLLNLCRTDPSVSERVLSEDLYAYLFDKGLPFTLESKSPSGKVDFLSSQPEGRRLVAEIKVYDPERGKRKNYVAGGYKQTRRYMADYLERIGYLIIFNTSLDELQFIDLDISGSLPSIFFENTRVYLMVVQLGQTSSASSQAKRRIVKFNVADFIEAKGRS